MSEQTAAVQFRSASTVEAPASSASAPVDSPTTQNAQSDTADAPPSLFQELEKKPYAIKYLDLDLYHDDDDFQDVRDQASDLDKYVLEQIKARGMKDTKDSYKEVIDAIYKEIGRSSNEDPTQSLKRLSTAASALKRLQSAKMPSVLDAKSLTPTEYEDIQP